jgi:hypothetical protein
MSSSQLTKINELSGPVALTEHIKLNEFTKLNETGQLR